MMHWIIQKNLFRPENYQLLVQALEKLEIDHTAVFIPNGTYNLEPEVTLTSKVYICGAIKLKKIAEQRGWKPGSFLNENFNVSKWIQALGNEFLNHDITNGKFADIQCKPQKKFFIRPLEDNKSFNGVVIDQEMLHAWQSDPNKRFLMDMDVVISSIKKIAREYRLFVVKNKIITGSLYKIGKKPEISSVIDGSVHDYVNTIINTWIPSESFVIDVALTPAGYKVIEFNNINSSGFYACDVEKYVDAIQMAYA